ncbi:MAG: hypothetical protein A2161_10015 [Candidatus Schekmanbacteria bacterium RBG_13_48_7]|uniref:Uncharacterized protein n=1 Tax=Candidatus Schekmanbacteria bacterium RBG_13_48_7 TaxID=1817878 RepID=A0A1F7RZ47_9BACT|nr:MAG: hypothetical protein A2161_10015 [Candidatus Schekmanbacteria bacterium RBG_13_48_7]
MYRNQKILLIAVIILLFNFPVEISSKILPKISLIVDGSTIKPVSVNVTLEWLPRLSATPKTVFSEKIALEESTISNPIIRIYSHFRSIIEFPDTDYLDLQMENGKLGVNLKLNTKIQNRLKIYYTLHLDETDWKKAISDPDTLIINSDNSRETDGKNVLQTQLIYNSSENLLYIILVNYP